MKRSLTTKNGLYTLLIVGLLAACTTLPAAPPASTKAETTAVTETEAATEALTITDGSGITLTFDAPPQRIVCLYTRCVEVLATLGLIPLALPSWIADVAAEPAYFPQPNDIIILAPTNDDVGFDLEELATLQPDLVLGWEELRPPLEGIAPLHAVTNDMDSYQESHAEIRAFARIFGREQQAEAAIQAFLDRLAAYQVRSPRDRSIIDLWTGEGDVTYRDGASGTCNLLKEVAECDWPDPESADVWSVTTSIEGLLQLDPDFILYDDWADAFPDQAALLAGLGQDPLWQELTAFQTGQIYETPTELYNLDGMGTIGAARMLDALMPLLYPDVFPEPLTDEEVQTILGGETYQPSASGPFTFTNNDGSILSFDTPPQRIICLFHECLELLAALEVEPIATSDWSIPRMFAADPLYFKQPNNIQFIPDVDDAPDFEIIRSAQS